MKKRLIALLAIVIVLTFVFAACEKSTTVHFVVGDDAGTILTVEVDSLSKIPTVTNGDKIFDGWYTDEDCTPGNEWSWIPDGSMFGGAEETVYAKWRDPEPGPDQPQKTPVSLTVYYGGSDIILTEDNATVEAIKNKLTVIAVFDDGSQEVVTDYTVSTPDISKTNVTQNVTVAYGNVSKQVPVHISVPQVPPEPSFDLDQILAQYADDGEWNFQAQYTCTMDGEVVSSKTLNFCGYAVQYIYQYNGVTYTDYFTYEDDWYYYEEQTDGTYTLLDESNPYFYLYVTNVWCIDLADIGKYEFVEDGDWYVATNVTGAANAILGNWGEDCTWLDFAIKIKMGKITEIYAQQEDVSEDDAGIYNFEILLQKYGQISFDLPQAGSGGQGDTNVDNDPVLAAVLEKYADSEQWNFKMEYKEIDDGADLMEHVVMCYNGLEFSMKYLTSDETFRTDYMLFSEDKQQYGYYQDQGDGTYVVYYSSDSEDEFYALYQDSYYGYFDFTVLGSYQFEKVSIGRYAATNPDGVGKDMLGAYEGETYVSFEIYIDNGNITKIVTASSVVDNPYYGSWNAEYTFVLSQHGEVELMAPDAESGAPDNDPELADVLAQYADSENWNFELNYTEIDDGTDLMDNVVMRYNGLEFSMKYLTDDDVRLTDYMLFSEEKQQYGYYQEQSDGTYLVYYLDDNEDEFFDLYQGSYYFSFDFSVLYKYQFLKVSTGVYQAEKPNDVGYAMLGAYEGETYSSFVLYVSNGVITKVVATSSVVDNPNYGSWDAEYTLELSQHGNVTLTAPQEGGNQGGENGENGGNQGGENGENGGNQGGETVSAVIDMCGSTNVTSYSTIEMLYQANGISVTIFKCSATSDNYNNSNSSWGARVYAGAKLDVSYTSAMTSIQITFDSGTYNNKTYMAGFDNMSVSGATLVREDNVLTITFQTPTTSFLSQELSSQVRILSIEVFCGNGEGGNQGGNQGGGESGENGGNQGGDTPAPNPNMMPAQNYNANTFDYDTLQDKLMAYEKDKYGDSASVGLPSSGSYSVLVVPVQFKNTTISNEQYDKLNKSLNGSEADTGWESVKTYYQKDSFGNLNLSFDIWGYNIGTKYSPYVSSNNYSYYANIADEGGSEVILLEVLAYLENRIDLAHYDTNGDGSIDGVYIVYSAPVDYDDDTIWWAYVTWYTGDNSYDGVYPYYYMFTGFDFMDEKLRCGKSVAINAETYIHETGHMLGLDDYYDYNIGRGSDRGMGGASMQDFNMGEHDSYSRIMLGWLQPTVITTTQTFTIDLSNASTADDCVMILLDSNNSYFCEYLLIDLYSATGLNAISKSGMYGGASFGARVYHVSSWCNNPYSDNYGSFTNYNNSLSSIPLIKLVEADGGNTKNTNSNGGEWAKASDLWQTGDKLSTSFANYTRNDGKIVNFDIEFVQVTANSVTITVTFVTAG